MLLSYEEGEVYLFIYLLEDMHIYWVPTKLNMYEFIL